MIDNFKNIHLKAFNKDSQRPNYQDMSVDSGKEVEWVENA
jgi:hypothetical protein